MDTCYYSDPMKEMLEDHNPLAHVGEKGLLGINQHVEIGDALYRCNNSNVYIVVNKMFPADFLDSEFEFLIEYEVVECVPQNIDEWNAVLNRG